MRRRGRKLPLTAAALNAACNAPVAELRCLGCGGTRADFARVGIMRCVGVPVPDYDELLPICSACEQDLGKLIGILAARVEPAAGRRRREVEVVLWRLHDAAAARLKQDLKWGHAELTLLELEQGAREHGKAIRHLEEAARRPPELGAIVRAAVGGWLARLARRWAP